MDLIFMFDLGIGFCGFGKVRWILWIWKSALDFVFDMDLEKCAGTANYITTRFHYFIK